MADVVIIGGGLIGMLTALELVDAGLEVDLIEKGKLGGEASSAAAGILGAQCETNGPGALFDFGMRAREAWPGLSSYLFEATGHDIGFRRRGALVHGTAAWLDQHFGWQVERGIARRVGDKIEIDAEAQVEPWRVVDAVVERLLQTRLEIHHTEVTEIQVGAQPVVITRDGPLAASAVVVTLGAWVSQLRPPDIGSWPQVSPQFGALVDFALEGKPRPLHFGQDAYVLWRDDNRVTAGFTAADRGFDKRLTEADIKEVQRRASALVPELADAAVVRAWGGLRPYAATPWLGAIGDAPVFAAAGHHRNGILHAPLAAEVLAGLVQRQTIDLNLSW